MDYANRVWKLRYFWLSLVRYDIARRYRGSFLGLGWSLVRPIGLTVLFCVIFGQLFQQDVGTYAPYLLVGLTVWQFLVESALHGCHCFHHGGIYVRQQPLPLAIFPLRVVLATGFHAAVALGIAVVALCLVNGLPSVLALLAIVPALLLLFILAWSVALLCGLLHSHFPDTHHLLELGLQVLFYLTPILYPPDSLRERVKLAWLLDLNPVGWLLEMVRGPLVDGVPASPGVTVAAACFVTAVTAISWLSLKRCERSLVFWV